MTLIQVDTKAGERLLWMVSTDPRPKGRGWEPKFFDARLTERIAEEFVPRIEDESYRAAIKDAIQAVQELDIQPVESHNKVIRALSALSNFEP